MHLRWNPNLHTVSQNYLPAQTPPHSASLGSPSRGTMKRQLLHFPCSFLSISSVRQPAPLAVLSEKHPRVNKYKHQGTSVKIHGVCNIFMGEGSFLPNTQIRLPLEGRTRRHPGFLVLVWFFFIFLYLPGWSSWFLSFALVCDGGQHQPLAEGWEKHSYSLLPQHLIPLTSPLGHTVVLCPALARVAACRCHCHPDNQRLLLWQSLNIATQRKMWGVY